MRGVLRTAARAGLLVGLAICALAGSASAKTADGRADFNQDGVTDSVAIAGPKHTQLVVRVSGVVAQTLHAKGRIVSMVAADLDGDGDVDLAALVDSHHRRPHARLVIWLNHRDRSTFTLVRPKRTSRGVALAGAEVPGARSGSPLAPAIALTSAAGWAYVPTIVRARHPRVSCAMVPAILIAGSADAGRPSVTRGPPAA